MHTSTMMGVVQAMFHFLDRFNWADNGPPCNSISRKQRTDNKIRMMTLYPICLYELARPNRPLQASGVYSAEQAIGGGGCLTAF